MEFFFCGFKSLTAILCNQIFIQKKENGHLQKLFCAEIVRQFFSCVYFINKQAFVQSFCIYVCINLLMDLVSFCAVQTLCFVFWVNTNKMAKKTLFFFNNSILMLFRFRAQELKRKENLTLSLLKSFLIENLLFFSYIAKSYLFQLLK